MLLGLFAKLQACEKKLKPDPILTDKKPPRLTKKVARRLLEKLKRKASPRLAANNKPPEPALQEFYPGQGKSVYAGTYPRSSAFIGG